LLLPDARLGLLVDEALEFFVRGGYCRVAFFERGFGWNAS
jgi:hypothetical protein